MAFLIHLGTGHTWQQAEARKEFYEQSNIDMPSDMFAKKMKLNWKDFIKVLSDRQLLKEAMQKEEELVKAHKKPMF